MCTLQYNRLGDKLSSGEMSASSINAVLVVFVLLPLDTFLSFPFFHFGVKGKRQAGLQTHQCGGRSSASWRVCNVRRKTQHHCLSVRWRRQISIWVSKKWLFNDVINSALVGSHGVLRTWFNVIVGGFCGNIFIVCILPFSQQAGSETVGAKQDMSNSISALIFTDHQPSDKKW